MNGSAEFAKLPAGGGSGELALVVARRSLPGILEPSVNPP
jgi:hypothetical protein